MSFSLSLSHTHTHTHTHTRHNWHVKLIHSFTLFPLQNTSCFCFACLHFHNFSLSQNYKEDWWTKLINFPFGFKTYFLNSICSVDRIIFFSLKGYNKNCVYCCALHEVVWLMWANGSVSGKNWTFALHCKLAVTSILYSKVPLYDYQYFYSWREFGLQITLQQHWT
jgi:hypothetical protein